MLNHLPPQPDFDALDAAALATADRRTALLALIGNHVFCWSNNESMLIYLLMLLLETDQTSAAIVFSTLNTTRARLDLIQRLGKAKVADRALLGTINRLVRRFGDLTRDRNELNHCIFMVDERGEITHTQSTRVHEANGRLQFGETRAVDAKRIKAMIETIRSLKALNRMIWTFLPELEAHMRQRAAARAERPVPAAKVRNVDAEPRAVAARAR